MLVLAVKLVSGLSVSGDLLNLLDLDTVCWVFHLLVQLPMKIEDSTHKHKKNTLTPSLVCVAMFSL